MDQGSRDRHPSRRVVGRGHLVMTGMMASGKTTIGIALARRVGRRFIDSDHQIEAETGRQVSQIEEIDGLAKVHALESAALEKALAAPRPAVIAGAASVIEDAGTAARLAGESFVVWLRIKPETIVARMAADKNNRHRPDFGATDSAQTLAELARLEADRASRYEANANLVLDVDQMSPEEAVSAILEATSLPELLVDAHAEVGEAPLWDPEESVLWWVDILGKQVHRFDPATGKDEAWETTEEPSSIALRRSGGLVVTTPRGICIFDPDKPRADRLSLLIPIEQEMTHTRTNDAKCDRQGRFWVGTTAWDFTAREGTLYVAEPSGEVRVALAGATLSNGMSWTEDDATFYWADSLTHEVYAFDFDARSGSIRGQRVVIRGTERPLNPDGLTLDAEGGIWLAQFAPGPGSVTSIPGGVYRYTPEGKEVSRLHLPVSYTTSICFGGGDLEDLYITTGRCDVPEPELVHEPHAGGLFRWRADVHGTVLFPFGG